VTLKQKDRRRPRWLLYLITLCVIESKVQFS
jgi:hypothetical protein